MNTAGADWQFVSFSGAVYCLAPPPAGTDRASNCRYAERTSRRAARLRDGFLDEASGHRPPFPPSLCRVRAAVLQSFPTGPIGRLWRSGPHRFHPRHRGCQLAPPWCLAPGTLQPAALGRPQPGQISQREHPGIFTTEALLRSCQQVIWLALQWFL